MTDPVVVVGAGAAAVGAVTGLRNAGFDGEVLVIGRESEPPYERPPLSKRYLLGEIGRDRLRLPPVQADLRLGEEVVSLDPPRRELSLAGGERMRYGRLLLATGAAPRSLPGYEAALHLREIADADRLRAVLGETARLQVIGAGFIGCEVASGARRLGVAVTVHEALEQPLIRALGPELGAWLGDVHRRHGVDLRTGVRALPPAGPVTLVAVGSRPSVELAEAAGIRCQGGILVDEVGRTGTADVYAAGDCARFWSPLFQAFVRVEHFQTALRHGESVGRAMTGDERPFAEGPWFWSDQYDLNIQYVGAGLPWDETLVRGRLGEPPFTVFFLQHGQLQAVAGVNDGRTVRQARRLLEMRVRPRPAALADPSVDLRSLAPR